MLLNINLAIRSLLELRALAALGYWGFHLDKELIAKIGAGLGAPLLAVVIWGIFVSPRASVPLPGLWPLLPEALVFGAAAVALHAAGRPMLCRLLVAVWAVNKLALFWLERP